MGRTAAIIFCLLATKWCHVTAPDAAIAALKGAFGESRTRTYSQQGVGNPNISMVIGAAFPRIGTNSLKLGLERLGFGPAYHIQEMLERGQLALWDVPNADYVTRSFS